MNVPLRPLTVLIGANDTGKSAFLDAVRRFAQGLGSASNQFHQTDHWRHDMTVAPELTGWFAAGQQSVVRRGDNRDQHLSSQINPVGRYALPSQGVSMSSAGVTDQGPPPSIESQGERVPALIDYLLRRDRKRFFALVEALRALIPGLEDVEVATPDAGSRRVDLVVEKGFRMPANQSSAGVRMLIFFVALAYHPSPPRLILLEEPENGIHPKRLADVMRLLREVTRGVHGDSAAQVILTTHSPYLLDLVDLDQDQVLVFQRKDDGSRTAEPADRERLRAFLGEFLLGEVWFNQGEPGLVSKRSA